MARDTSTLRDILFDELDALRDGSSDPKRAQAVAKLSAQIISTAKVELEYHKVAMKAKAQGEEFILGSMDLGSRAAPVAGKSQTQQIEHRETRTQASDEPADC